MRLVITVMFNLDAFVIPGHETVIGDFRLVRETAS
jgi:hypothetical protein